MILLDNVTKFYPGDSRPALDHVSLHIEPNEFAFLVGKSGAGKSTLMKMITKEETPDKGKIIIGGIDLDYVKKRYIPHYRRRLGVVFQDFKLLPGRTVYENVAFALEIAGMSNAEIEKTVPKVLDLVGLAGKEKKFPRHLSGGEQQRVSIARSVARQPKILIADEPTGNLDKLTRGEIIDLLQKINDFGTTVLVTTHDENIVNNLQKRVITLKDGQIVSDQKNGGVYRLDKVVVEQPVIEKQPLGRMFAPRAIAAQAVQTAKALPSQAKALSGKAVRLATSVPSRVTSRVSAAKSPALTPVATTPTRPTAKPRAAASMIIDSSKLQPTPVAKAAPTKLRATKSKVI